MFSSENTVLVDNYMNGLHALNLYVFIPYMVIFERVFLLQCTGFLLMVLDPLVFLSYLS